MNKIDWKYDEVVNSWEGFVNDELCFVVEGNLCLTDIRDSRNIKHYRATSDKAKEIANDLLNNINLDEHKANNDAWEETLDRTAKVLRDAQDLINTLKEMQENNPKL